MQWVVLPCSVSRMLLRMLSSEPVVPQVVAALAPQRGRRLGEVRVELLDSLALDASGVLKSVLYAFLTEFVRTRLVCRDGGEFAPPPADTVTPDEAFALGACLALALRHGVSCGVRLQPYWVACILRLASGRALLDGDPAEAVRQADPELHRMLGWPWEALGGGTHAHPWVAAKSGGRYTALATAEHWNDWRRVACERAVTCGSVECLLSAASGFWSGGLEEEGGQGEQQEAGRLCELIQGSDDAERALLAWKRNADQQHCDARTAAAFWAALGHLAAAHPVGFFRVLQFCVGHGRLAEDHPFGLDAAGGTRLFQLHSGGRFAAHTCVPSVELDEHTTGAAVLAVAELDPESVNFTLA